MLEDDAAVDADSLVGQDPRSGARPSGGERDWAAAVLEPVRWMRMLCRELGATFVAGVVLVYGLSQGFAGSFFRVASDYYWKDVQRVQPATVQFLSVFFYIPWVLKPLWGIMTDVFPVCGYRRRPYFLFSGILGTVSAAIVAITIGLPVSSAVLCLVGISTAVAIADVTIDACIAKNSIDKPALAPDMQSLCAFSSSLGALVGYATSGMFVHHLGAQGALGVMAIPPATVVFLGFFIYELKARQHNVKEKEFVGLVHAIGAVASMLGVLVYHKCLKDYPFRSILLYAQLLYGVSGLLDLTFVLRWNLALGVPDAAFVTLEECVSRVVGRVRLMPMMVLSTKLCPPGVEGTFFALLMCIDSLGMLAAKAGGAAVLRALRVTRTDFGHLWLAVLLRNLLRLATLGAIGLVPTADQTDVLVPRELLVSSSSRAGVADEEEEQRLQLAMLTSHTDDV